MLSTSQIDDAVRYNGRQGYSKEQVRQCQQVTGAAKVDGLWGPVSVQAVARWQAEHGLLADGKVGPQTYQAIVMELECDVPASPPSQIEIGCGLAAYDQSGFPGHTAAEAMRTAWEAALGLGSKEIRFWSSEHLIKDIGNKGNSYSEPFMKSLLVPDDVRVGAWIDDPISAVKQPGYADRLVAMNVTSAALMMNKSNTREHHTPWALRWKEDDLKLVADLLHARDIEIILTAWPRPSKSQIDMMCEDMEHFLDLTGAVAFEVDTEGNWTKKFLDEIFASMRSAAQYLAMQMRGAAGPDRKLELTTYTYHTENSKKAKLAPLMDRLLPQAYSVRNREDGPVEWSDALGPGRHQRLALSRAHQAAEAA